MLKPRATVIVPCFGRPSRTRRLLNCLSQQTIMNYEAFIVGDGCPHFEALLTSQEYKNWLSAMTEAGTTIYSFNLDRNHGGHGYYIRNYGIQHATSPYIMFVDNDDVIADNHIEHYLSEIEGTEYEMVYYSTMVRPDADTIRNPELRFGGIGHSEIIISTDVARKVPPQTTEYGHDWLFINNIIQLGVPTKKATSLKITYYVMSIGPEKRRIDGEID